MEENHFIFIQAPEDNSAQVFGDMSIEQLGVFGNFALLLDPDGERSIPFERNPPREHLIEDDAERINIRSAVDVFPFDLLRAHVFGRADYHLLTGDSSFLGRPGNPEIHDSDVPLAVDHDVRGFEVAVDDAETMRFCLPFANLPGDMDRGADSQLPAHPDHGLKVFARHVLHGDEMPAFGLSQVEHPADMAVGDFTGQPELIPEALDRLLVLGDLRLDELESDLIFDLGVKNFVNLPPPLPSSSMTW